MKYPLKLLTLTLIILGMTHLDRVKGNEEKTDGENEIKDAFSRGAVAWAENCGRCHNHRGPQEFRPDQWHPIMLHMRIQAGLTGQTARDILAFLTGKHEAPPEVPSKNIEKTAEEVPVKEKEVPQAKPLQETKTSEKKPSEIKAAFQKHPAEQAAAQPTGNEGEKIFQSQGCTGCHGANGKGTIPQAPDFTAPGSPLVTKSDAELAKIITKGGPKHIMPAHPSLNPEEIKEVLKYMKSKFAPK
jgi:mono/diheme cytochrome c family protein